MRLYALPKKTVVKRMSAIWISERLLTKFGTRLANCGIDKAILKILLNLYTAMESSFRSSRKPENQMKSVFVCWFCF